MPGIGDEVAMDGVRVIEVEDFLRKVGTVIEEQIEVGNIAAGIESLDQRCVLFGGGVDFEAPDAAVVGRAEELDPFAAGDFMFRVVGDEVFKVVATIRVAQFKFEFGRDVVRDLRDVIDGIEISEQRHRQPVVSINAVIAAEHNAGLALFAGAEVGGSVGANAAEVNGGVAGRVHGAETAKGLFEEQGRVSAGRRAGEEGAGEDEQNLHGGSHWDVRSHGSL
jgi:hypothetical protein